MADMPADKRHQQAALDGHGRSQAAPVLHRADCCVTGRTSLRRRLGSLTRYLR